jgi:D-glycero-alpha-D-manno-heptose-7-phosphate kinase
VTGSIIIPPVTVMASAPTRVDLAGGTIDIWPLYLFHPGAQTVNAALGLRAHVRIDARDDDGVLLVSDDLGLSVGPLAHDELPADMVLPLLAKLVHAFGVSGVTVTTRSEAPAGAGIAGSSALNIAVTAALDRWTGRGLDPEALLEIAKNVEAQVIRVPTGLQDYRPALHGGIAALELGVAGPTRVALGVPATALSERLVLAYTGAPRASGINNWEITKRRIDGDPHVIACFDAIVTATAGLRAALERQDWAAAGASLADEWRARTRLAPAVTTTIIDALLAAAVGEGAWAGKVCGAGGGGCVFCLAPPERTTDIRRRWQQMGAEILDASIELDGVRIEGRGPGGRA